VVPSKSAPTSAATPQTIQELLTFYGEVCCPLAQLAMATRKVEMHGQRGEGEVEQPHFFGLANCYSCVVAWQSCAA